VYPLEYIVGEIGQETVDVSSVFPPGVDGHSYEPSMQEMTGYADGDGFFYVGGVMEAFSDSIAVALSGEDVHLVGLSDHETLFQRHTHDEAADGDSGNLMIEGAGHHYHTGDTIELNASYDTGPNHFHWYTRASVDDEWSEVTGQYQDELEIEATHDVGQVKVAQFDDNHDVMAESEPVEIVIDDHGEGPAENMHSPNGEEVTIEGVEGHYHTGDLVVLTVSADEDYDELQWYTMSNDSDEWEESGQAGESFEGEANGAFQMVKVELLDENGNIISESEPVEILIDDHDDIDPHIWVDPIKMIEVGEIVLEEMIALNPGNESSFRENFEALKANMEALDQEFDETLDDGSEKHIIVPHAAFGYWDKYGIEQIPVTGYTMTDEPSQSQLAGLIDTVREYELDYVLHEQNSTNTISEVIQNEIGAEAEMIHNMEVRTEEDITNDEDYISLMQRNLEVLEKVTD
jgi:zinc transport system substrate-binding protein